MEYKISFYDQYLFLYLSGNISAQNVFEMQQTILKSPEKISYIFFIDDNVKMDSTTLGGFHQMRQDLEKKPLKTYLISGVLSGADSVKLDTILSKLNTPETPQLVDIMQLETKVRAHQKDALNSQQSLSSLLRNCLNLPEADVPLAPQDIEKYSEELENKIQEYTDKLQTMEAQSGGQKKGTKEKNKKKNKQEEKPEDTLDASLVQQVTDIKIKVLDSLKQVPNLLTGGK